MTELVWVNEKKLDLPQNILWEELLSLEYKYSSFLPRFGSDISPWAKPIEKFPAKGTMSFSDITDLRSVEVETLSINSGLPILVHWSGGIDSTAILAAMLKNYDAAFLENVHICLNISSVEENSDFFVKYILNKFRLVDSAYWRPNEDVLSKYIHVTGHFADQLYTSGKLREKEVQQAGIINSKILKTELTEVLRYESAKYDIEIETQGDLYWWIVFNYCWSEVGFKDIIEFTDVMNQKIYNLYNNNWIGWYGSTSYQSWGVSNKTRSVYSDAKTYKMEIKEYIYDFDKNSQYLLNKEKVSSVRTNRKHSTQIGCILSDGSTKSILDLRQNIDLLKNFIV